MGCSVAGFLCSTDPDLGSRVAQTLEELQRGQRRFWQLFEIVQEPGQLQHVEMLRLLRLNGTPLRTARNDKMQTVLEAAKPGRARTLVELALRPYHPERRVVWPRSFRRSVVTVLLTAQRLALAPDGRAPLSTDLWLRVLEYLGRNDLPPCTSGSGGGGGGGGRGDDGGGGGDEEDDEPRRCYSCSWCQRALLKSASNLNPLTKCTKCTAYFCSSGERVCGGGWLGVRTPPANH